MFIRNVRVVFFIFILTSGLLLSAEYGPQSMFTRETSGIKRVQKKTYLQNNFSTFEGLGGRSALGFNFSTMMYGIITKPIFTFIGDIIDANKPDGIAVGERGDTEYGFAFSLYYDFAFLDYFTVGFEAGISYLGGDFIIIDTIIQTYPWSVNLKFFPAGNAPVGFFISPKFGATPIFLDGQYFTGYDKFKMNSTGFYASVEIGWRISLYPKTVEESKNRITLDISVLDVGYYFVPWNKDIYAIIDAFGITDLNKYRKASSMRVVPFPKIGISFTF